MFLILDVGDPGVLSCRNDTETIVGRFHDDTDMFIPT